MNFQQLKSEVSKQLELKKQFRLLEIHLFREELHRQFLDQVGLVPGEPAPIPVNRGGTKKC